MIIRPGDSSASCRPMTSHTRIRSTQQPRSYLRTREPSGSYVRESPCTREPSGSYMREPLLDSPRSMLDLAPQSAITNGGTSYTVQSLSSMPTITNINTGGTVRRMTLNTTSRSSMNTSRLLNIDQIEEIPTCISGTFVSDLNILRIDELIVTKLIAEERIRPMQIENELVDILDKLNQNNNIVTTADLTRRRELLIKELQAQQQAVKRVEYSNRALPLLTAYYDMGVLTKEVDFLSTEIEPAVAVKDKKRLKVIQDYLEIAGDYISININIERTSNSNCQVCGADMREILPDPDGSYHCGCGFEIVVVGKSSAFLDNLKMTNTPSNSKPLQAKDYKDRDNFWKALTAFQCRQVNKLPTTGQNGGTPGDKMFKDLDKYFASYGMPTSDVIKKLPLNERGYRKGTSRQMIIEALAATNYNAYYDDANLIMHLYWDWPAPDVSDLEEKIMDHYDKTQAVFRSLPDKERESSPNIQVRLWYHLTNVNYPCNKEDFKVATSPDVLADHDGLLQKMCEGAKHKDIRKLSIL